MHAAKLLRNTRWTVLWLCLAALFPACQDDKPAIRLAVNSWLSAALHTRVAAIILEEQLGYPVELVEVDEFAQWPALAKGELDASLEIWPSGQTQAMEQYLGKPDGVENLGFLGVVGKIGWYVPAYVVEEHPLLASWQGFTSPRLAALFRPPGKKGKGRFLSGDPKWFQYDQEIIGNLGLDLDVAWTGSEDSLIREVKEASAARRPILFYFWFPHILHVELPLREVKLPPYNDQCYAKAAGGGVDCGYPPDILFKAGRPGLRSKAPGAHRFLRNLTFTEKDLLAMMTLVNQGESVEQAARHWMSNNAMVWTSWLPGR